jgi:NADH dehydrogenase
MREQTYVIHLLPLRLFAGWVFFVEALAKLAGGWLTNPRLSSVIEGWLRDGKTYSFYAPFLRSVVLPHAQPFAYVVAFGELFVGAALLAGAFTRAAALGGILLVGNFLLARGDRLGANATAPFLAMLVTLLLTRAGRALGLDAALRDRVPGWLS